MTAVHIPLNLSLITYHLSLITPIMLTLDFIREAAERVRPFVHRTPVITSRMFDEAAGRRVFFKCENFQRAGAFKMRGATNKIQSLTDEERGRGVVAYSSGNHAQAVAL